MSIRRAFAIAGLLATLVVLGTASVAVATDEAPAETEEAVVVDAPDPAIPIPEEPPADATPEWSYRFLVPATMVLGALAVVGTIFMYFVRVTRNRYRVVE